MRKALLVAGLVTASFLAPAIADATATSVISDCNLHGRLTGHYSTTELRGALSTMPADVKEYTDCYDVIQSALLSQLGGSGRGASGSPGHGSGGSLLPTPVVVVLVLLGLSAVSFGAVAVRRRRSGMHPGS